MQRRNIMKRKISILVVAVSVLIILVSAIMPHHHHRDLACIVMEFCQQDSAVNDVHTNHHADDGTEHGRACVAETDYYAFNTACRVKYNCDNHIHFFPFLYLNFADILTHHAENTFAKSEYGKYISFYTFGEAAQFHGLRAPPAILS